MTILSGGRVVLPDRVLSNGSLVIEDGRIVAVEDRAIPADAAGRGDRRRRMHPRAGLHRRARPRRRGHRRAGRCRARSRRWPRGCRSTASPRSVRPSVACAPDTLADVSRRGGAGTDGASGRFRARAARASRKQLHQSRVERRPAGALPARVWRTFPRRRRWRRVLGRRGTARDGVGSRQCRDRDGGAGTARRARSGPAPAGARAHRVHRPLGRQLRRGARGHPRRGDARDPSVQPDVAPDAPRPRGRRRRARVRRRGRRGHL